MNEWPEIHGINAGVIEELYEQFSRDPDSVDEATRQYFRKVRPLESGKPARFETADLHVIVGVAHLAECIRRYGHLAARLDPLGHPPPGDPSLELASHGLTEEVLRGLPVSVVGGPVADRGGTALDGINALRKVYCSTTGYDYAHIFVPEERAWLRLAAESGLFRPPVDPIDEIKLLDRITQVEVFERFLHRAFPGKTRFSVEGLDMLIPVLDEIIADAAPAGTEHVLIGMAHRGRLNVLAHILQKPYAQILAEFKDPLPRREGFRIDLGRTGDVKYHSGARVALPTERPAALVISLAPNPSHLEFVDPVVVGMARAAGCYTTAPGPPRFQAAITLPVLIHGDAAFPGQGVVAETLNLYRLDAYQTGGTIHIIVNNQLGFTATPEESYSTSYASGLARGFKIPIVHVNADDPVACVEAARLAWAYRARFQRDFLIDLIGYRRHGHNEGDEPSFTQPVMYRKISAHPTVRQVWAKQLEERNVITSADADAVLNRYWSTLERTFTELKPAEALVQEPEPDPPPGAARVARTAVELPRLQALNTALLVEPPGFTFHRKLERARERRRTAFDQIDERTIDWAMAEELAFASILEDGVPIRLTGEDVERGTFSHRHAVFHDAENGHRFVPLESLPQARASFEIHNSPLSENATVAFEYGYNVQAPERLVLWEAQYGDFINGAQVVLDEFIVSARAKWGLTPSLVLLLPHGYEGQGPDHSSARPERFLQAAADINLRLANCTTAAQYFHLLRRQALLLETDPLPLVVLTPKSLLRHPLVASTPRELAEGRFQPVIDDEDRQGRKDDVRRLILCSGKVWVDLVSSPRRQEDARVAVCRVEQLYPFPSLELGPLLESYSALDEVVWLQEEPQNMGAWEFVQDEIERLIEGRYPLRYIGRPRSASPAEGSTAWHLVNQRALIDEAYASSVDALLVR